MSKSKTFSEEVIDNVKRQGEDAYLVDLSKKWVEKIQPYNYCHSFTWMGLPIIQCPQDIVSMQELIWRTKPDLIIETGIAHGGSLVFYASMLELLGGDGEVVGIDIDIRKHNRIAITSHPMNKRIIMFEGSSTDPNIVSQVKEIAQHKNRIMVCLDSNHTHDHVLKELQFYAPLVAKGNYCVVFDTGVEDLPDDMCLDRPWGKGNNPKTAVHEYLKRNDCFVIDKMIEHKLLITAAPDGYLLRVK
jgi:cephalosporin hydroxylase